MPRLIPRLRTPLKPTGRQPRWLVAVLSELNAIGVFVTLAFLSWGYDNWLMVRAIIVSFGAGIALEDGDWMEVQFQGFGRALRNPVRVASRSEDRLVAVRSLA